MGLINIFNSVSNDNTEIRANGKIKDILPGYNFSKTVILNSGVKIDENYEVKENDVIFLRVVPGLLTALTVGVALSVTAVTYGVFSFQKELADAQKKAQRDSKNLAQQINQLPFIKGAKNKVALGNLIQYQLGRGYNTPYLLTDGSYHVANGDGAKQYGTKQFWSGVLSLGFGDLDIEEVLLGDETLIKNTSGISSGVHLFRENFIYYGANNFIEIAKPGETFKTDLFNKKIILTQDGAELVHNFGDPTDPKDPAANGGTPLIRQVATNTKKLEVCIQFNGLREYDSNNSNWKERLATVKPYWSNNDGETWHEFYFENMNNNSISLNTRDTVRFVATKEFAPSEVFENVNGELKTKNIVLKVVKVTPKAESNTNEDCYLLYYQSLCYDAQKSNLEELVDCKTIEDNFSNKLTRLAIHIEANSSTENILNEVHAIATAKAKTFNGETWSEEKSATTNPASQLLEVLTSDIHKPSKHDEEEIDLNSFGKLYNYCEIKGYTCNTIISSNIKKSEVIKNILSSVGASLIINNEGKLEVVIDKEESLPVALLNSECITSASLTKDFSRRPDGVKVTYTNSDTWQIDTFYVMLDPSKNNIKGADDIVTELSLNYITDYIHAYAMAMRYLKTLVLQPRTFKVNVGRCGDYYPIYSLVLLQHKEFMQGLKASTITNIYNDENGKINGFEFSDYINFEVGKYYGVIIQAVTPSASGLIYARIVGEGVTRKVDLYEPLESGLEPQLFNIVSIGYLNENGDFNSITNKMKITAIEPDGSKGYSLTLKDYNQAIYETGTIPPYVSNLTRPPKPYLQVPARVEIPPAERGENGKDAFNYLGVFNNVANLPNSTNGDFFLCGEDQTRIETLAVNGEELNVNGDALGVIKTYHKGIIYYSTESGVWLAVTNKNDYRYIVAANDLELMGENISPALNSATVEKVYKETGIDALDDKKIIDEETKYIKADLIDVDKLSANFISTKDIQSGSGTFTGLKADKAELTDCSVSGVFESEGGYRYNNKMSWITGSLNLEEVIEAINYRFGDYTGKIHCYAELVYLSGSTIYRGYGICMQRFANGGFNIRGYAAQGSGSLAIMSASFNYGELSITIGGTTLRNAQGNTTLEIFY